MKCRVENRNMGHGRKKPLHFANAGDVNGIVQGRQRVSASICASTSSVMSVPSVNFSPPCTTR